MTHCVHACNFGTEIGGHRIDQGADGWTRESLLRPWQEGTLWYGCVVLRDCNGAERDIISKGAYWYKWVGIVHLTLTLD